MNKSKLKFFTLPIVLLLLVIFAAMHYSKKADTTGIITTAATTATKAVASAANEKLAYFAGGCFWSMESSIEPMPGVLSVISGFMGGHLDNPTYDDVSSETTGHLE